jgi:stage II sporulation protein AA (anti-sigma F factor antagonist)
MPSQHTGDLQIVPVALRDGEIALCLEGELDYATVGPVRARLREIHAQSVVLDLSGVTFTDSTGLALLLEERADARRRGTRFGIRGAGGQTLELLERTGVLALLTSAAL